MARNRSANSGRVRRANLFDDFFAFAEGELVVAVKHGHAVSADGDDLEVIGEHLTRGNGIYGAADLHLCFGLALVLDDVQQVHSLSSARRGCATGPGPVRRSPTI